MSSKNVLLTGGAGFIGSHLSEKLLSLGYGITVIDNLDNFYSPVIKKKNLEISSKNSNFRFVELDIRDYKGLNDKLLDNYDLIIHLAAKAGVLPSIQNPLEYTNTNIIGTQNLLEFAKNKGIKKFIFGSSSSVYGVNANIPWSENDNVLKPISPYAATKVSGELLGQVYSSLYEIQFLALRFFTVYGPRQRPDLAIHKFTRMIIDRTPIPFFGDGLSKRDYTYIDDIINGIMGSLVYEDSKYEIFNLGNNNPISLTELVNTIESVVKEKAIIKMLPNQVGDVPITYANIEKAQKRLNYRPSTSLKDGISSFFEWFKTNNHIININ
jgi:UDP-glucuronate 4-epimerase